MQLKGKEFVEHSSGLFVSMDGEVWFKGSGRGIFPNGHFTYGCANGEGYKRVTYKDKEYKVHRLVGECYLPNPNNYDEIDHIDRNPSNNNVENLRWADRSIQCKNRVLPNNNANSKAVLQYSLEGELVREWPSAAECGRNGFRQQHVSACCNGKLKHHKKYIWKYAD